MKWRNLFFGGWVAAAILCFAESAATYKERASDALLARAREAGEALARGGFIPSEEFTNQAVTLHGQTTAPLGFVNGRVCSYAFMHGQLSSIRRRDLFEDKGPDSLILRHLTNQVLTLTTNAAGTRAMEVLRALGFDAEGIKRHFGMKVSDDLMDAFPIRNGSANFPKDLRFFGELISRKKIRIKVNFGEFTAVEFLATTGELLEAQLPALEVLRERGIAGRAPIEIADGPDFTKPIYHSAVVNFGFSGDAEALVKKAWSNVVSQLGTNKPVAFLVCDNLNEPEMVSREMSRHAAGIAWAGISHHWEMDVPIDAGLSEDWRRSKRGISIMAISGGAKVQFGLIDGLNPIPQPTPGENEQAEWKALQEKYRPKVDRFFKTFALTPNDPDHVVFAFMAAKSAASSVVEGEIDDRLRNYRVALQSPIRRGQARIGYTYLNGRATTNSMLIMEISGFLPLQMDTSALLRKQPEHRMPSWQVYRPIEEFAATVDAHPMMAFINSLGMDSMSLIQEAKAVEVLRLKAGNGSTNGETIEGLQIVGKKQLQSEATKAFVSSVLGDKVEWYPLPIRPGIPWQPEIGVRFSKGAATITFFLDLKEGQGFAVRHRTDKVERAWFSFHQDFQTIRNLAERSFPTDMALKQIKLK